MAPIIARWTAASASATDQASANPSSALTDQLAAFTAMAVPETMEHVLDHLHERWGGGAGYFLQHGQPAEAIDAWRTQLLEQR